MLSNPQKRETYDRHGLDGLKEGRGAGQSVPSQFASRNESLRKGGGRLCFAMAGLLGKRPLQPELNDDLTFSQYFRSSHITVLCSLSFILYEQAAVARPTSLSTSLAWAVVAGAAAPDPAAARTPSSPLGMLSAPTRQFRLFARWVQTASL